MGELTMPSLGSQMVEAKLVKWLVKPGDYVQRGDIIGEIHTEKGLIDIEAFEDGYISELRIKEGEMVQVGQVMAVISERAEKFKVTPAETFTSEESDGQTMVQETVKKETKKIKASPLARNVAKELKVDLSMVAGSGPGGTIHKKDVEAAAAKQEVTPPEAPATEPPNEKAPPQPTPSPEAKAEAKTPEREPAAARIDPMRKAIADAMSRSNREIPHYYLESEIDMKPALDWLEKNNKTRSVKERIMPPILQIKAVANALGQVAELNGYWTEQGLEVKESIHIGFTISLRRGGLVIPAILHADTKTLDEIRVEFVDMVMRAREGHLRAAEVSSATTTITSLGERGARKVYGVIYPPQVSLIGFGKVYATPRAINGAVGSRPVLTTVLAADHRATDGHTGSRFLEFLEDQFQHPENL